MVNDSEATWGIKRRSWNIMIIYSPMKISMERKHGGLVQIMFLSKWVICGFHVNLPGCMIT